MNLLLSGKIPEEVARFFFGGSLTALLKIKNHAKFDQDDPTTWDVRPICVGETFLFIEEVGRLFTKMYQITVEASLRRPQLQTETPKK